MLVVSVALHILILRLAAHHLFNSGRADVATKPKTLHISLSPAKRLQTQTQTDRTNSITSNEDIATQQRTAQERSGKPADTNSEGPATRIDGATSKRILATARDLAHSMSRGETEETAERADPIASAFAKALNPPKEPPGVSEWSDGTVRVVTGSGLVYCIRPNDEPGIAGPEDAITLAVTCN